MCGLRIGCLVLCLYTSLMNGLNALWFHRYLLLGVALYWIALHWVALRCHSRVGVHFIPFEINSFTFKYSTSRRLLIKLWFVFFSIAFAYVCLCIPKMCQSFVAEWLYDFWILRKLWWIMYANVIDPQPQHSPLHCILFACLHRTQSAECWWTIETGQLDF